MPRGREFNEEEVLEKAVNLFWKQGYHATSMQELVDNLGINRASLYNTFGDKEQLFNKALQKYRSTNSIAMKNFLEKQPSVKEGLLALFQSAVEQCIENEGIGCFVVNTTTELLPCDTEICNALANNKEAMESLFEEYVKSGIEKGQISKEIDPKAMASMLFTQYNGIKVISKIKPDRKELLSSVRLMLSVLDS